jgi:hypothetical protein
MYIILREEEASFQVALTQSGMLYIPSHEYFFLIDSVLYLCHSGSVLVWR